MRIDFHSGSPAAAENSRANAPSAPGTGSAHGAQLGQDQAQLSGGHVQVTALAAQASQLPEIREERVQALREAVHSGNYLPDAQKVAGAMIAHMVSVTAA